MSNLETVKLFYKGWENQDKSLLHLSENFFHKSPEGEFNSGKSFLDACWKYSGVKFKNKLFTVTGDNVYATYEYDDRNNKMKISEKFYFEDGLISKIEVSYE